MSVERDVNRHEMLGPAIEQKHDECDEEMDRASRILLCHPGYSPENILNRGLAESSQSAPWKNIIERFCGGSVYAKSPLQFLQHVAAPLTNRGVVFVLANMRRVIPAAVALCAFGFLHFDVNPTGAVA